MEYDCREIRVHADLWRSSMDSFLLQHSVMCSQVLLRSLTPPITNQPFRALALCYNVTNLSIVTDIDNCQKSIQDEQTSKIYRSVKKNVNYLVLHNVFLDL